MAEINVSDSLVLSLLSSLLLEFVISIIISSLDFSVAKA
jgi:hypothetical protein